MGDRALRRVAGAARLCVWKWCRERTHQRPHHDISLRYGQLCSLSKSSLFTYGLDMDAPPAGLRERKKLATRQALHQAAVGIAVERGLQRLTIEAIADAADVSRRTFSNYFASKEEALLYSDQLRVRQLLDLVRARPEAEAPWLALSAAALQLVSDHGSDPRWVAQMRLLRRQPSLLAQQIATYGEAERALAQSVAERLGPSAERELRARLLAAALLTALRVAVQQWVEDPRSSLPDILARVLDLAAGSWS